MEVTKQRNMVFEAVGRVLVVVHSRDFPNDAEWDAYLQALEEHVSRYSDRRSLVVTEGGAPSTHQRARMATVVGESMATTAVVSSSSAVRATVRTLSLTNPAIRAFEPEALDGAIDHLGVRDSERREVLKVVSSLQQQVGPQSKSEKK